MKIRVIGIICILLVTACVSSGRFALEQDKNSNQVQQLRVLEQENSRLRSDIVEANRYLAASKEDLHKCEAKLAEVDRVQKEELLREVAVLRGEVLPEAQKKAYYEGQLELWKSLRIVGISREEGFLFKKRYFHLDLYIGNSQFFSHEVQTDHQEANVSRAFSDLITLASLTTLFPR